MRQREIDILQALEPGNIVLKSLESHFPRSSLYRIAGDLVRRGLAKVDPDGRYSLTAAGQDELDKQRGARDDVASASTADSPRPRPQLPFEALMLAPSETHRAVLELAILARVVRMQRPSHHASFALVSSPLRGKTWLMSAAALLLGAEPERAVLHAGAESGKSLAIRRNSQGTITTLRGALSGPLLAVDEFRRGSPDVMKTTQLLLHGNSVIPLEGDERLDVKCVVMLAMNPPKEQEKTAPLDIEACGLDSAMVRRSFVVHLDKAELDRAFADDGDDRLDKIAALGAVRFPSSSIDCEKRARKRVRAILEGVLDSTERLASLDLHLLGQLVWAGGAWLPFEEALALVLWDACLCYSTLGWLREEWRSRLYGALAVADDDAETSHEEPTVAKDAAQEQNPFDFQAKTEALLATCRRLHLAPAQAEERLRLVEALGKSGFAIEHAPLLADAFARAGKEPRAALEVIAKLANEHGSLEKSNEVLVARLNGLEAQCQAASDCLAGVKKELDAIGWEPKLAASLRELHAQLGKAGLTVAALSPLAEAARALAAATRAKPADAAVVARDLLGALTNELGSAESYPAALASMKTLAETARRGTKLTADVSRLADEKAHLEKVRAGLEADVATCDERKRVALGEIEALSARIEKQRGSLEEVDRVLAAVAEQHDALTSEIAFANEIVNFLYDATLLDGELRRRLAAVVEARRSGAEHARVGELSEDARRRVFDVLKSALDRDLVARWELDSVKDKAKREAAAELRQEFKGAAQSLADLGAAITDKWKTANDAAFQLFLRS